MRLTLRKEEKLRHRSLVEALFREGNNIYDFPLRLSWRHLSPTELEESFRCGVPPRVGKLQMLITVPKKKRRHAVDRVLMRRRIREAYRLHRHDYLDHIADLPQTGSLNMAFIYLCDKDIPYDVIEEKMKNLLRRLSKELGYYELGGTGKEPGTERVTGKEMKS